MGAFKYLVKRLVKNKGTGEKYMRYYYKKSIAGKKSEIISFTKTQLREEKLLLKAVRDSKKEVAGIKRKLSDAKGAKRNLLASTAGKKAALNKSKSEVDRLSNMSKQIKERMAKIGSPPWPPGTMERVKKYTKMQKDITKKMAAARKKL